MMSRSRPPPPPPTAPPRPPLQPTQPLMTRLCGGDAKWWRRRRRRPRRGAGRAGRGSRGGAAIWYGRGRRNGRGREPVPHVAGRVLPHALHEHPGGGRGPMVSARVDAGRVGKATHAISVTAGRSGTGVAALLMTTIPCDSLLSWFSDNSNCLLILSQNTWYHTMVRGIQRWWSKGSKMMTRSVLPCRLEVLT